MTGQDAQSFEALSNLDACDPDWQLIDSAQRMAEALHLQVFDYSLSEEEELKLSLSASELLTQLAESRGPIFKKWLAASKEIDPNVNLAGFLDWDGESEPQKLREMRITDDTLKEQGQRLSSFLFEFAISSYLKHNPEKVQSEDDQDPKQLLAIQIVSQARQGKKLDISEPYDEVISKSFAMLRGPFNSRSQTINLKDERFQGLKGQKELFKPEYAEKMKKELADQAGRTHEDLDKLWEILDPPANTGRTHWQEVISSLCEDIADTDASQSDVLLIYDAVSFLANVHHQYGSVWSGEEIRTLHRKVQAERQKIEEAKAIAIKAEALSDEIMQINMLRDLQPRIKLAIGSLIANAGVVTDIINTVQGGLIYPGSERLRHDLEQVLCGPPPPEDPMTKFAPEKENPRSEDLG
jgi:hypothetical protein